MRNSFIAGQSLRRGAGMLRRAASFGAAPAWLTAVTPTADIYFLNAMAGFVSDNGPLRALGPNVYGVDGRYVVLRYTSDAELGLLEQARPQRVTYVIDDDLEALSRSAELPAGYRSRLAAFVAHSLPRILAMSDTVVAPNRLLLSRFPGRDTGIIAPSYCSVAETFDHFTDGSPARIVFTGTRSHAADLEVIAPALERLLTAAPQVELTTFLGSWRPARLRRLGNVVNRPALPWAAYRRFMAASRFHLALAPFRPTATNQCRSHNKVHDHAAFGAAGLYGDILPYRETIDHGGNGLLLPPDPQAWHDALAELVQHPASARRLAWEGAALSHQIGSPDRLRAFWCEHLGLDVD